MTEKTTIAVDVMGSDNSPATEIEGIELFLQENPNCNAHFNLYGKGDSLFDILAQNTLTKENSSTIETQEVILPGDKPSLAIRQKRQSSMFKAVKSVADGQCNAVISSGNTGAFMAISRLVIKTLDGINRPAIIASIPTAKADTVILDLGANVDSDSDSLVQFAIMGMAFVRVVMKRERPRVALLNIGEEEMKGTDSIREAHNILSNINLPMEFVGYIESNKIFSGNIDVVVTDGFAGNLVLKAIEGCAKFISDIAKAAIHKSILSKVAGWVLHKQLKSEISKVDPRTRNGGLLLGLNGIVVKSHGSADPVAFSKAVQVAFETVQNEINAQIVESTYETSKL